LQFLPRLLFQKRTANSSINTSCLCPQGLVIIGYNSTQSIGKNWCRFSCKHKTFNYSVIMSLSTRPAACMHALLFFRLLMFF